MPLTTKALRALWNQNNISSKIIPTYVEDDHAGSAGEVDAHRASPGGHYDQLHVQNN
jgi:hypothetical protein